jgi:hypothetical protein
MTTFNLSLAVLFVSSFWVICVAQDIIVTTDAQKIEAKVIEVNTDDIKYYDFNNLDGPIYVISKSEVISIVYSNGYVELFSSNASQEQGATLGTSSSKGNSNISQASFLSMSDREIDRFLFDQEQGDIYAKFHKGMKMRKLGWGLLIPGLALNATSVLLALTIEKGSLFFPFDLIIIGQAFIIASIPISAVAGSLKKSAKNNYVDDYIRPQRQQNHTSLNFGATANGIGLVLKF